MKHAILLMCLCSILMLGCSQLEKPELKDIKNLRLAEMNADYWTIKADALIHNPNAIGGKIGTTSIEVFVNDSSIGMVDHLEVSKLSANEDSMIPIEMRFEPKEFRKNFLGKLVKAIDILTNKQMNIHLKGDIGVVVGQKQFSLPLDFEKDVPVKL